MGYQLAYVLKNVTFILHLTSNIQVGNTVFVVEAMVFVIVIYDTYFLPEMHLFNDVSFDSCLVFVLVKSKGKQFLLLLRGGHPSRKL